MFGALTENEAQLSNLITSSKRTFDATARRNDELAETIRIFPTFLDESKATVERLETFSRDTRPLIQDLRPVAQRPAADAARRQGAGPRPRAVLQGPRPADRRVAHGPCRPRARCFDGLEPLLGELAPFLGQVNPILQYLELSQYQVSDFISYGGAALADTTQSSTGGIGHYLRQFGVSGSEAVAMYRQRLPHQPRQHLHQPAAACSARRAAMYKISAAVRTASTSGGEKPPSGDDAGLLRPGQPHLPGTACRASSRTSRRRTTGRVASRPLRLRRRRGRRRRGARSPGRTRRARRRRARRWPVIRSPSVAPSGPSARDPGGQRPGDARGGLGLELGLLGDLHARRRRR